MWTIIHAAEVLVWVVCAFSVGYVAFFSLVSVVRGGGKSSMTDAVAGADDVHADFLVVYPAYHEDAVIAHSIETFLKQDYPREHYRLVVVSDHMMAETNQWLAAQPLMLLQPTLPKSSKAKALQFAMQQNKEWKAGSRHRKVVILDADNVVAHHFLSRLNAVCCQTHDVIQCHRTAKNADNDIAALDGISEEINNTIFRRAHNMIGLSSALIGSGMCFDFEWFDRHVQNLSTAVEDRELEAMIMRENIHIRYVEDLYVMDEKVSSSDNFQRQRLRWMTGQVQALLSMLPTLPHAIRTLNVNYVDKTLQQMLIPRSILLAILPVMAVLISLLSWPWSLKWWGLLLCFALALLAAIPPQLRTRQLFGKMLALPSLLWRMMGNIARINYKNSDFIHTTHNK